MINKDIVEGKWNQFKGEARIQWGKLTDDDWQQIAGNKDKLYGMLQERYGYTREEAERSADEFFTRMNAGARNQDR